MKKLLTLILCCTLLLGTLCMLAGASGEQTTETSAASEQSSAEQTENSSSEQSSTGQAGQTTLPESASYTFINSAMGYGSGTLKMTMPAGSNAISFALYWGDASGARLPAHTSFLTGTITTSEVSEYTLEAPSIPTGAKTILVYTYSLQYGESSTPYRIEMGNYILPETGKQIAEFVVVSDLHIGSGQTAEKNTLAMLNDVKKTAPNAVGIIVVGDAVEAADESFYQQLGSIRTKIEGAPALYLGTGDRTYLTRDTYAYNAAKHQENLQLFLKYASHPTGAKLDKPYYSYTLGGVLMIFIGADSYRNGNAVYSQEQLTWLDNVLNKADEFKPAFVFMHEPLPNTVSGSLDEQGYGNVQNANELKEILKKYDNVCIFNGHTQWPLEADRTMVYLSGGSRVFNTAGVAHLWEDQNGAGYEVAGNQGYYVTVYEDAVLVRGRNFSTGEWISNAIYMFSTKSAPAQTAPSTQSTKPATTKKPVEEESTEPEEESGIRDLIPPLCILACMAVIVFIFIFRKPKNQE